MNRAIKITYDKPNRQYVLVSGDTIVAYMDWASARAFLDLLIAGFHIADGPESI